MAVATVVKGQVEEAAWHEIQRLLRAGEYGPAASLLYDTGVAADSDRDEAVATILEATRQMCLAGSDYQDEAQYHKEAYHSASAREQRLRQQLLAILRLIMAPEADVDATLLPDLAGRKRREIPGLLRRVRDLLGLSGVDEPEAANRDFDVLEAEPARVERPPQQAAEATEGLEAAPRNRTPTVVEPEPPAMPQPPVEQVAVEREPALVIYCLGMFRVFDNSRVVNDWTGNKSKSILKYLILHRDQPVHRDVLVDLFWRDDDPEAARRNLYQTIYMLRQALQLDEQDFQYILCENSCYLFNPRLDLTVDFELFLKHYEAGQQLERSGHIGAAVAEYEAAESCYEGDLLMEDLYEEWTLMMRERLKNAYLDALDRVSRYYWSQRQFALCIAYCQKILQADSCREDVHRRLMLSHVRQGHRHLAVRQYYRCVEAIRQELDATPMPETVELYEQIRQGQL